MKLTEDLPGFDNPVGLLRACHDKILLHCDLLERCLLQPDPATAKQVHRYFSKSAPLHHSDEEEDVFPLLARTSTHTASLINKLGREHAELRTLWEVLEPGLQQLPDNGFDSRFMDAANRFIRLNRAHVEQENRELLPAAAELLDEVATGALGEAMAARRGASYSGL